MLFDIAVFDGVDELDVVGPLEVLRRAGALGAGVECRLVGRDEMTSAQGAFGLTFQPQRAFEPGEATVVVVPGGGWVARSAAGVWAEVNRGQWPRLLAEASRAGSVMAGVCTGSLLLAHAGVIGTRRATTHHDALADLAALGVSAVRERVVDEGDLITSGGVTSGIDLGLWLLSRYFGEDLTALVAEALEYNWSAPAASASPG
ncbi:MAG TPA: DJ-1/PfpI family protein [Acidimicrobiales bacterium]|nr:DJ-1/PfpI family protein [Acidimicrobiales bacterium]